MSQNFTWPSVSVQASSPSTGPNGTLIPTQSTLVGGEDPSGDLQPLQVNASKDLLVEVATSALPSGAATAANQTSEIAQLTGIHSDTTAIETHASSLDTKTVHVDTGSVTVVASALPSGAATESSLSFIVTSSQQAANNTAALALPPGSTASTSSGPMVMGAATTTAPTYSTGQLNPLSLTTAGSLRVEAMASALPAGAATAANQATEISSLGSIVTNTTGIATAANQVTGNTSLSSVVANQTNGTQLAVVSQPTAADLNATVVGTVQAKAATPAALTITQAALTVGTTAVRLTVSGSAPSSTRVVLVATPDSAATGKFYIGSSTVTSTGATRGVQIVTGQVFTANNDAGDYWIISDTAAQIVEVLEQA